MSGDCSKLKELYSQHSKHSNYQILPKKLAELIGNDLEVKTRYEMERLEYILKNIDITNKTILDIGGNTGYFTFELLEKGARKVHYFEGNGSHSEFVKIATQCLNVEDRVKITNEYYSFKNDEHREGYDVVLLLNVLHHTGDDYGEKKITIDKAKETIIEQLNNLSKICDSIAFQLGFNWKGNRDTCLFDNGTKKEMIEFIKEGTTNYWEIMKIGIAEKEKNMVEYRDSSEENLTRRDDIGEFLNRPIFIMKSIR